MEAKAHLNKVRISPRKVRLVADLVRDNAVAKALVILSYEQKRAAQSIIKLINSAVANATNNNGMEADKLWIKEIFVNEGPTMKRFMPRAHGRAYKIFKRTSKITIVVGDKEVNK